MSTPEIFAFCAACAPMLAAGAVVAGFGTALVALAFWLRAVEPRPAGPLVAVIAATGRRCSKFAAHRLPLGDTDAPVRSR